MHKVFTLEEKEEIQELEEVGVKEAFKLYQ